MYLTVSKKFEISFSHRCYDTSLSEAENFQKYGDESRGEYGHGHNCDVTVIFTGPVDSATGMMINISDVKPVINELLEARYDHKFLNDDTPPFNRNKIPTFESIAQQLVEDISTLFSGTPARVCAVHLYEKGVMDITAYADGRLRSSLWFDFSVARRTLSPHLSDKENQDLFGVATNNHGHHYRVRLTPVTPQNIGYYTDLRNSINSSFESIINEFDHRYLNDHPDFKNQPTTTERLAAYLFERISEKNPLQRLRISENDYFYIEYDLTKTVYIGMKKTFHTAHRLHSNKLTAAENISLYGKCNNPAGHGHTYNIEILFKGKYDSRSGTAFHFSNTTRSFADAISMFDYKHLDRECDVFKEMPTTSENIAQVLWDRLSVDFSGSLSRLRLWETPNNRFTLRASVTEE